MQATDVTTMRHNRIATTKLSSHYDIIIHSQNNSPIMFRFLHLLLIALVPSLTAFTVLHNANSKASFSTLHLFSGLSDAFKNDDKLSPRKNEGLTGVRISY
jgi:hypothetical protein